MFMRNLTVVCAIALATSPLLAEDSGEEKATERTSATLPERLEETGERAPMEPPRSSAEEVGEIDVSSNAFGVGQPATEEQISAIDIDVMPDGQGLPEGSGTFADGKTAYDQACAACHGSDMEGVSELGAPALLGGRGTLADDSPVKTVESYWPYASTLYDYVHRAMPLQSPGSLSPDEVYAISAYILGRAGIISDDPDTTLDADSMAEIKMPNADGFVEDPRPDVGGNE
ncbi:c-type cytochrome [Fodinicurvata fenggangensis]|uniref:c-type cytochrome n=1 Tax=Fodinicurvata fenggangensis TaxID=1121830 RepID=UPI000AB2E791|nr:cytochrome c [Fodinicurvata fenggangensis]